MDTWTHGHAQAAALQQQPAPPDGTPLPCASAPMHRLRLKKLGAHHITALALSIDGQVRQQCQLLVTEHKEALWWEVLLHHMFIIMAA